LMCGAPLEFSHQFVGNVDVELGDNIMGLAGHDRGPLVASDTNCSLQWNLKHMHQLPLSVTK
jgi:hypothetical protein